MALKIEKEDYFTSLQKKPIYWTERAKTELTEEIVRLMEEQRVTKKELAQRLGTSQSYITKVLNENVNFTIESMSKIAFALGNKIDIRMTPIICAQEKEKPRSFQSLKMISVEDENFADSDEISVTHPGTRVAQNKIKKS